MVILPVVTLKVYRLHILVTLLGLSNLPNTLGVVTFITKLSITIQYSLLFWTSRLTVVSDGRDDSKW